MPCLLKRDRLAPVLRPCVPGALRRHVATDWLILSWLVFLGCVGSDLISAALLYYALAEGDNTGIFDWASGLVDMLLFTVGSMCVQDMCSC